MRTLKKAPRNILMISAVAAVGVAGSILATGPAEAVTTCNSWAYVRNVNLDPSASIVPIYGTGTTSSRSLNCNLYKGTSGDGVRQLQMTLNECYGPHPASGGVKKFSTNLATDGQFGSATEKALKTVQSYVGVTADGWYGPETRKKMKARANNGSGNYCMYLKLPVTWW
ncbi:putative peptidoglycan binding protein [Kribbella sp. VKM Ac-2569]|uniref:peptidoglycan-binding domain-containing protein n=1 Tax=Kribbella sp. VKM Ac-2569 TaxID=2512220 RepID=UPI00102B5ECA|nr:peptidoglycan-binding domain-containing protein [Kribbella sp. VKM Ac-2569]RZT26921.1 putative peptidoglycan binding protein [Kribbella sp. VKM Ac-2569]